MSRRMLAALAAVVVALAIHWCGGGAASQSTAASSDPTAHGQRADLLVLATAVAQLNRRDVTVGRLQLIGRTVDDDDLPIAGATVTLNGTRTTTSAGDGSFTFDRLAAGDYDLVAEHGNYYGETSDRLTPDDVDPEIVILRDGPGLTLHVVDRDGAPVFGAKVSDRDHNDGYTDRDGVLRQRGLRFGFVRITVAAPGYATEDFHVDAGDDPRRSIERRVVLQATKPIGGIVVGPDGQPIGGVEVSVAMMNNGWSDSVDADGSGHWRIDGFGYGKVEINASGSAYVAAPDQVISLDDGTPHTDLVVHVLVGASIGGVVVDTAGNPIAGATVDVDTSPNITTDRDGKFNVLGVDAGDRRVNVSTDKLGSPPQHVTLARGQHVELRFQLEASSISGIVVDTQGKPASGVLIHAEGAMSSAVLSDAAGHFDLAGLPPGSYVLTADRMDTMHSEPKNVTAHSGDHDVRLEIPDAGSITGRVVMNGQPVDYFGVAIDEDSTDQRSWPGTDPVRSPDGRFTKTHLWPRMMMVAIVGPGFERKVIQHVAVPAGGELDLGDIEVSPGRVLRGHVVDESGAPIADAAVIAEANDGVETEVSLDHDLQGTRGTHTDAAGAFELAGLPADASGLYLQASTADKVATSRQLTADELDTDVRIVVRSSGSVDGAIVNGAATTVSYVELISVAEPEREFGDFTERDGSFHFDRIPPGDYVAKVSHMIAAPTAFHVTAGTTTRLEIANTATPVTLDIDIAAGDCVGVHVKAVGSEHGLGFGRCDSRTHATLEGVVPGSFTLCNRTGECTVVEVAPAPAQQHVTIPPAPPEADDPPDTEDPPTTEPSPPTPPPQADPSPSPSPDPAAAADPAAAVDEAALPAD